MEFSLPNSKRTLKILKDNLLNEAEADCGKTQVLKGFRKPPRSIFHLGLNRSPTTASRLARSKPDAIYAEATGLIK
jgi:hypothetical protein